MGFHVDQEVEPLDYDFGQFGGKGTVPEPTHDQVEQLFKAIRGLVVAAGVDPGASREQVIQAFAAIPEDEQKRQADATMEALIDFCQGSPSREEIESLPYRPLNAFLGWLVGQFAGEPGKGATQPSRATPNGAAPVS